MLNVFGKRLLHLNTSIVFSLVRLVFSFLLNLLLRNSIFECVFNYFQFQLNLCHSECHRCSFSLSFCHTTRHCVSFWLKWNILHVINVFPLLICMCFLYFLLTLAFQRPISTDRLLTIIENWFSVKRDSFTLLTNRFVRKSMQFMMSVPVHELFICLFFEAPKFFVHTI